MKKFCLACIFSVTIACHAMAQSTWTQIPSAPEAGRFDDMYFTNDSTGYISQNSEVYETTDKGDHWKLISLVDSTQLYYVRSIEFLNDSVGFAGLLYSANPLSGNLFKTVNGGRSWTLLQNMQIESTDGICGMAHFGNRLSCVGTWSGPAWFYRSDDYGLSWTKTDMSSLASGLVDCFMMNKDTILVSGIADAGNENKATILKSVDGGMTWQRVYLAPNASSFCWKMFFRPDGLGLASVEFGPPIVARTTDYGSTWTTESVYNSDTSDLGGMGLLNDTLGWVTNQMDTGTWETHDGGLSWKPVKSEVDAGDRMVVLDSLTALLSGVSVFKYVYKGKPDGIQNPPTANKKIHSLIVYPNPADKEMSIVAMAGTNTFGMLDILDEQGVEVMRISRQPFIKGKNIFTVDISHLAAGHYQLLWRTNELFLAKSFVIVK